MPHSFNPMMMNSKPRALACVLSACSALALLLGAKGAHASGDEEAPSLAPTHKLHLELDPQPFVLGGHGVQIGWRPIWLPKLRVAVANFALDVPDPVTQFDDENDGFHLRVRPTPALFVHAIHKGFLLGGSLRYLRLEYKHDDFPGESASSEDVSLELIVGYRWFPSSTGFYLHPWLGLSASLHQSGSTEVGDRSYQALPIQPFATVNLGWELSL